jgi:hypothetical protein
VPDATLLDIQPLLTDELYRNKTLAYVTGQYILNYWNKEFNQYTKTFRMEAISPILNKTGLFLASAPLRATVGQKMHGVRMQEVMIRRRYLSATCPKESLERMQVLC